MSEVYSYHISDNDQEFIILLRGLIAVSEAIKGTPAKHGDWVLDAEGLLPKTVYHVSTVYYLSHGTKIPPLPADFLDPGSIQVLVRATLESVLVFHYVFAAPETDADRDLRYAMWCLSGLLNRQRYTPKSTWGKQRQQEDAELVKELRDKICCSNLFQKLTAKQQRKILTKGEWRLPERNSEGKCAFPSWVQIATAAGLSKKTAYEMYSHLSSYAHSSYLSVLQLRQAVTAKQREMLTGGTMGIVKIAMALMARLYTRVFPKAKSIMLDNEGFANTVDMWIDIGSDALEDEEIDWDAEFGDSFQGLE